MSSNDTMEIFLQVSGLIKKRELRERIILKVLDYCRTNKDDEIAKDLKIFKNKVEVAGFRPGKAPEQFIIKDFIQFHEKHPHFQRWVILIWKKANPKLFDKVSTFIEDADEKRVKEIDQFLSDRALEDLGELIQEFSNLNPNDSIEDVEIMFYYTLLLTNSESESEDESGEAEIEKRNGIATFPDFWKKMMTQIDGLSFGAAEWDYFDDFLEIVKDIKESKKKEFHSHYKPLKDAIGCLLSEGKEGADYFKATDIIEKWDPENCEPDESSRITDKVKQLHSMIAEFRKPPLLKFENIEEEDQEYKKRNRLRSEIETLIKEINKKLKNAEAGESEPVQNEDDIDQVDIDSSSEILKIPLDNVEIKIKSTENSEHEDELPGRANKLDDKDQLEESDIKRKTEGLEIETDHTDNESNKIKDESTVDDKKGLKPEQDGIECDESEDILEAPSLKEAVEVCLNNPDKLKYWNNLICTLLSCDDISGAYWVSRSLETDGNEPIFPSELIAAFQGSQWLSFDSEYFLRDMRDLAESFRPLSNPESDLLALSAALHPVFMMQSKNYLDWLRIPSLIPESKDLIEKIIDFLGTGVVLSAEDLSGVVGVEKREGEISETSEEATAFLENAYYRKSKFQRASGVWRNMVGKNGDLRDLLLPVCQNKQEKVTLVRKKIKDWARQELVLQRIKQIEHNTKHARLREIVGGARQYLLSNVDEAVLIAEKWCKLVENKKIFDGKGDWFATQIAQFRNVLHEELPKIEKKLNLLLSKKPSVASAATCLWRSLFNFQKLFEVSDLSAPIESSSVASWAWLIAETQSIYQALSNRLLWVFKVELNSEYRPKSNGVELRTSFVKSLLAEDNRQTLLTKWLEQMDFRSKDTFLASINAQEDNEIIQKVQEKIIESSEELKNKIADTTAAIEQAVVDGIIAEERAQHIGDLETIDIDETENFRTAYKVLQDIRDSLDAARKSRLNELKKRWETVQPQILSSKISDEKKRIIEQFVAERLLAGDTRVVEENLSHLDDFVDRGVEPEDAWFKPKITGHDSFQEFMSAFNQLNEWFNINGLRKMIHIVRNGQPVAGLDFDNLKRIRRHEIADAFTAWHDLKHGKPAVTMQVREKLLKILRYLGFTIEPEVARIALYDKSESNWWHGNINMSAGDLARPFPQFGSQAHGNYDVVCFWGRPDPNIIGAKLAALRLSNQCIIVIFFGVLSIAQRSNILRMSQSRKLAMAVLDEILFAFLTQEQETRLPVLLRCSLPFSATNPYTPFKAGDVPPEMFFGRENMARQLQEPGSSCFVYGGRQLGKSALLRHVEREFHDPQREQYAHVEDIKLIGDPGTDQFTGTIWEKLREVFKEFNLISSKITTTKPEEIKRYLNTAMHEKPNRRVLILFDEADNFLEADARDNFKMVDFLRILMADTGRRVKIVFAGLHSVQRYQGIPNQPLAHFGTPICVGPLEPKAARLLVEEPLSALGFKLDDVTALRILSYTNYHPGLIQLFCQELLSLLQSKYKRSLPPYFVSQELVESVYRKSDVYNSIKERFDWTLALDPRYQAVAWSLIVDQMDARDSYAQSYSTAEILELTKYYWPQGFNETDISTMRGLLDELIGLGVLVKDRESRFRLRSPNLVRIMGTQEDVFTQLSELSTKETISTSAADHYHVPLDEKADRFSPFTHTQERQLNPQTTGVGIVFASEALGLYDLPPTFKRFIPGYEQDRSGYFEDITGKCEHTLAFQKILNAAWQKKMDFPAIIFTLFPKKKSGKELADLIEEAIKFTGARTSQKRWMRIFFALDSDTTVQWHELPTTYREALEEKADAALFPYKLDKIGIQQRLSQSKPEKVYTEDACSIVKSSTGGWPWLVNTLFDLCKGETDARPGAIKISNMLSEPNSKLSTAFRKCLGVETYPDAWQLTKALIQWDEEEIPEEIFGEYLSEEYPNLFKKRLNIIEYLKRFGIIDVRADTLTLDPIVRKLIRT